MEQLVKKIKTDTDPNCDSTHTTCEVYRSLVDAAQEASNSKDLFLTIASHELNTPLTALKMQYQLRLKKLSKDDFSYDRTAQEKMFKDDLKHTNRLIQLVEDLLEISRINSGKLVIKKEKTDFKKIVEEIVFNFEPLFEQSQIQLDVLLPTNTLEIECDAFRIEQVITNLLSNAIRYGKGRPVLVSLEHKEGKAVFKVKDHGIGIEEIDLNRIFEKFERAISPSEISGMGIGLYIAKQIVLAHNGSIEVESKIGIGSTFIVELPLTKE